MNFNDKLTLAVLITAASLLSAFFLVKDETYMLRSSSGSIIEIDGFHEKLEKGDIIWTHNNYFEVIEVK